MPLMPFVLEFVVYRETPTLTVLTCADATPAASIAATVTAIMWILFVIRLSLVRWPQSQPKAVSWSSKVSLSTLWPPVVGCTPSANCQVFTSAPARSPLYGTPVVELQNSDEPSVTAPPVMALIAAASQAGTVLLVMPYWAGLA